MMKFLVKQQKIEVLEREIIASDQIAFVSVKFVFDGAWKTLHKVVQFTQCEETYNLVLGIDGTTCLLPAELHPGAVKMSLFGYDAESDTTLRATTVPVTLHIRPSGFVADGDTPIPPTPDLYTQLLKKLSEIQTGANGKDGRSAYEIAIENGFVGEITEVNPQILYDLLEKDFLPIICPVGMDAEYNSYNINADDAACAIAKAVKAEKLAFLTDIEGVYKDPKDKDTLISELRVSEARELIGDGFIGGGMLPKLNNCIDAIENGVSRVHILDGRIAHCLLLEIFTNRGIGTAILGDKETKFYHE